MTPQDLMTNNTLLWYLRFDHMIEKCMQMFHSRGLLSGIKSCKWDFYKYCVMGK